MMRKIAAIVLGTLSYPYAYCFFYLLLGGRISGGMAFGTSDGIRDLPDFAEWGTVGLMIFGLPILALLGLFGFLLYALQIRSTAIATAGGAFASFGIIMGIAAFDGVDGNAGLADAAASALAGALGGWIYGCMALTGEKTAHVGVER